MLTDVEIPTFLKSVYFWATISCRFKSHHNACQSIQLFKHYMQPQGIKTKVTALYCIPFIFAHPSQRGMASTHRIIAREQRSACGQKRGGVHRVEWFRAWPYWGDPQGLKYTFKIIQYKTMIKYSLWLSAGLEEYENVFPCFRFIWALAPVLIIISWALWPRKQLFVIFCKLKIFFAHRRINHLR